MSCKTKFCCSHFKFTSHLMLELQVWRQKPGTLIDGRTWWSTKKTRLGIDLKKSSEASKKNSEHWPLETLNKTESPCLDLWNDSVTFLLLKLVACVDLCHNKCISSVRAKICSTPKQKQENRRLPDQIKNIPNRFHCWRCEQRTAHCYGQ